jgi:uncharacterized membrane protein YkoI
MTMTFKKTTLTLAAAVLAATAATTGIALASDGHRDVWRGIVVASDDSSYRGGDRRGDYERREYGNAFENALPIPEILDKLKAEGYGSFHEIDRDHGVYEVKAVDAKGARVELKIDPATGKILRSKHDD